MMKLNKILAGFTKTIADLEAFQVAKASMIETSEVAINNLQARVEVDKTEAERAKSISEKLEAIIG